jgi:hypothetical protein
MFDKCDRCSGPLTNGYETRDFGRDDATGYADVEFICADCIEEESPSAVLVIDEKALRYPGIVEHSMGLLQHADRIEILSVTYKGN